MVKMCGQLTASLAQCAFICQQEIMAVYSIEGRMLRLKPMLMREMTMKEVFKKAICYSAASSLYCLTILFLYHH
jgi:hypothetical protein